MQRAGAAPAAGHSRVLDDSDRLEPIIDPAVRTLEVLFTGGDRDEDALAVGRLASSSLGAWARLKQSERAREAVLFSMARELAGDREELARYIKLTMPDAPLVQVLEAKRLPAPKKK